MRSMALRIIYWSIVEINGDKEIFDAVILQPATKFRMIMLWFVSVCLCVHKGVQSQEIGFQLKCLTVVDCGVLAWVVLCIGTGHHASHQQTLILEQWQIKGCGRSFRCTTFSLIWQGFQKLLKKQHHTVAYSPRNPRFANAKVWVIL